MLKKTNVDGLMPGLPVTFTAPNGKARHIGVLAEIDRSRRIVTCQSVLDLSCYMVGFDEAGAFVSDTKYLSDLVIVDHIVIKLHFERTKREPRYSSMMQATKDTVRQALAIP